MNVYFQGMGIGAGLIIAIGAQNAFVLSQGIKKQHHLLIATICSLSDMLLICIGTAGVGTIISQNPVLQKAASWGGALFLLIFGLQRLRSCVFPVSLGRSKEQVNSLKKVVLTTLALTFLNPHVYIDTVLLLGGIAGQYDQQGKVLFASGASTASVLWFFSLAFCGKALSPLFEKEICWRVLDFIIFCVMWIIAYQLLRFTL